MSMVTIERVVVILDAASESRTAIDTAARLAARTKVPFHGIFAEDEDLFHLAALPFARQLTIGAGAVPLTSEHVELHSRAQGERARRELFAAATQHEVKCTFDVTRGASTAIAAAVTERDLVVAGGLSRPIARHFRVKGRKWLSADAMAGPILFARAVWAATGSVVAVLRDRDAASARVMETSAQIAAAKGGMLTVICPPAIAGSEGFARWIADRIAVPGQQVRIEAAPVEPAALYERMQQLDCRLLAVEADLEDSGDGVPQLAERFLCDMLIVP